MYNIGFPLIQPPIFPKYAGSTPIVRWLIVATALAILDIVAIQALWGLRDLRPIYVTQIVFPILRIAMLAFGAWLWGVNGILGSQVVYYVVVAVTIVVVLLAASVRAQRRRALTEKSA